MSDPLGFDALGLDINQQQIQQIKNPRLQRAMNAYRKNVLVRGVTMVDRNHPQPVGLPIGEDGEVLTLERRRELAAARTKYSVDAARVGELDYVKSDAPIETEKLGTSAQRAIERQPDFTIVTPRELPLNVPLTEVQQAEIDAAEAERDAHE